MSDHGFALEPSQVRLDYFRGTGKWYETRVLDMEGLWEFGITPRDAVVQACDRQFGEEWLSKKLTEGWHIVVLDPYHKYAYPIMLVGNK